MKFESGKWYKYSGSVRDAGWNSYGKMDFCLDHKPHQCNYGNGTDASFFDSPDQHKVWNWNDSGFKNWEEVKAPKGDKSKVKPDDMIRYMVYGTECDNKGTIRDTEESLKEGMKIAIKDSSWTARIIGYKLIPLYEAETKVCFKKFKIPKIKTKK